MAAPWQASAGFQGRVSGRTRLNVPIAVEDRWLKMIEPCTSGSGTCVSNEGVLGLTKGSSLEITGRTTDGRPASVTYSLRGYTAAVNAMNALCSNGENTGWLIR
jgi:hypothetical protein